MANEGRSGDPLFATGVPVAGGVPVKSSSLDHDRSRADADFMGYTFRKEVIQPQVPLRLPCYDFTPVADPTVDACLPLLG